MKKKVLSLLLTGAMIAAMLTGCGNADANTDSSSGETDQTESTEAAETGKEIDISFYTTETGKDDMFQQLISDFESKNPGIKVEYIAAGDDQLQQWMALYSSNEGPTVSYMDPINIYENQERMRELTNESLVGNINESALATFTFDLSLIHISEPTRP